MEGPDSKRNLRLWIGYIPRVFMDMRAAKGDSLATGSQKGLGQPPGRQGWPEDQVLNNSAGERSYRITK